MPGQALGHRAPQVRGQQAEGSMKPGSGSSAAVVPDSRSAMYMLLAQL